MISEVNRREKPYMVKYSFLSQSYYLEDVKVVTYGRLTNMATLALSAAMCLGFRIKLTALVYHPFIVQNASSASLISRNYEVADRNYHPMPNLY